MTIGGSDTARTSARMRSALAVMVTVAALCGCTARAERRDGSAPPTANAPASGGRTFESADAAWNALVGAVRSGSTDEILTVLGNDARPFVASADGLDDAHARRRFLDQVDRRTVVGRADGGVVMAYIGGNGWPFPIPLVHGPRGWYFDTAVGRDALVRRRIQYNEMRAAAICRSYAYAQHEYAARQIGTSTRKGYARRLISTPGTRDGLYWRAEPGAAESPMAALVAAARAEGYDRGAPAEPVPYYGYLYRVLTAQGPHAPGGAHSYLEGNVLTRGFALVGWPAEYDATGVRTFIVNQDGIVYQRDLGPRTAAITAAMTAYDPDASWTPAP